MAKKEKLQEVQKAVAVSVESKREIISIGLYIGCGTEVRRRATGFVGR